MRRAHGCNLLTLIWPTGYTCRLKRSSRWCHPVNLEKTISRNWAQTPKSISSVFINLNKAQQFSRKAKSRRTTELRASLKNYCQSWMLMLSSSLSWLETIALVLIWIPKSRFVYLITDKKLMNRKTRTIPVTINQNSNNIIRKLELKHQISTLISVKILPSALQTLIL